MARVNRSSLINPEEVTILHTVAKASRNLFLLGEDFATKTSNSHRKDWILEIMEFQSSIMAIDLLGFAIMCNHIHQILRSRPDVVKTWDNQEIARRWMTLCPKTKKRLKVGDKILHVPIPPKQSQIDALAQNERRIAILREQLSSISWWMRLLCQKVAQRANLEDGGGMGPLWKGRFHATVIEDFSYLLGCTLYVDLNANQAGISQAIEDYPYTSAKIRLDKIRAKQEETAQPAGPLVTPPDQLEPEAHKREESNVSDACENSVSHKHSKLDAAFAMRKISKGEFLSEFKLESMSSDPQVHQSGFRCSDKGYMDYSIEEYLDVLEWCIKNKITQPQSQLPERIPFCLETHPLGAELVFRQAREFDQLYRYRAGSKPLADTQGTNAQGDTTASGPADNRS